MIVITSAIINVYSNPSAGVPHTQFEINDLHISVEDYSLSRDEWNEMLGRFKEHLRQAFITLSHQQVRVVLFDAYGRKIV